MMQNENKEITSDDFQFASPQDEDYQEIIDSLPQFAMNRAQRRAAEKIEKRAKRKTSEHLGSIVDTAKRLTYFSLMEKLKEKKQEWKKELETEGDNEDEETN